MPSLPLATLLPVTLGEGAAASSGVASDSDVDAADSDDDAAAPSGGLASWVGSSASGMPGDLNEDDEHEDILVRPSGDDDTKCTDGGLEGPDSRWRGCGCGKG